MVVVGVTDHAQEQLGDIVLVEVPKAGEEVTQGEPFGVIESTKSVADLYSPVTGIVAEGNADLIEAPELVNEDPYGEGWIMKVTPESLDELDALMTPLEYEEYLSTLDEP